MVNKVQKGSAKANKVKKSIEDSKRKRDFKQRHKGRFERKQKNNKFEDKFTEKKRLRKDEQQAKDDEEEDMEEDDLMGEDDGEEEEIKPEEEYYDEFDPKEALDAEGHDLDLPESESEDEQVQKDLEGDDTDSELEDYYKELGIQDEEDLSKPKQGKKQEEGLYKKQKKSEKGGEQTQEAQKESVVSRIIASAKENPTYATVTRVIKIVKQVFSAGQDQNQEKEEDEKKPKKKTGGNIGGLLNSKEYRTLIEFFAAELPPLVLRVSNVGLKAFTNNGCEVKKAYGHLSSKQQLLLKTYAANFNKILGELLEDGSSGKFISSLLAAGPDVVKCCLPYGIYCKKLISSCARVCVMYHEMSETSQVLAFNALRFMLLWSQKETPSLFDFTIKKMYNEFTKVCKVGGGGYQVQNNLRVAQNCFVELLGINSTQAYQLGFLYIRQLCLHLRNIRNNLTKEAIKNIYSWQFFNCMKLWVLALITHQKELVLLTHPLIQLAIGVIRISNNIKYFPYHIKVFQLMSLINEKTGQFVPMVQYILYPFDPHHEFLNSKSKPLADKAIPDTIISLKIAKKHLNTFEIKDRIVKEIIEELSIYFANSSRHISFPELVIPVGVVLRKFKKHTTNSGYRKIVAAFLDLVKKNEDLVVQKRLKLKDKSLKNINGLIKSLDMEIGQELTPLEKEKKKIEERRAERIREKIEATKKD